MPCAALVLAAGPLRSLRILLACTLLLALLADHAWSFALRSRAVAKQRRAASADVAASSVFSASSAVVVAVRDGEATDANDTHVPFDESVALPHGIVAAAAEAATAFAKSDVSSELLGIVKSHDVPLLLVGINTAPANFQRRADVRASWMRDPLLLRTGAGEVQARFIVGQPSAGENSSAVEDRLAAEQVEFGDIVQLQVHDTYDALTTKTLAFFQWFTDGDAGPRARFAMKIDDDTFPHLLPMILRLRQEDELQRYSYMGFFHECAAVKRAGRNAEALSDFSETFFPTYASGSGYVLSAALAHELVFAYSPRRHAVGTALAEEWGPSQPASLSQLSSNSSVNLVTGNDENGGVALSARPRMLHNEDASVGLWINDWAQRRVKDAEPVQVDFVAIPATLFGCSEGDVLSMNLAVGQMPCMWEKRQRGVDNICCSLSEISTETAAESSGKTLPTSAAFLQTGKKLEYRRLRCEGVDAAQTPPAAADVTQTPASPPKLALVDQQALTAGLSQKMVLQADLEECCSRGVVVESSFTESPNHCDHGALAQLLLVCAAKCPAPAAALTAACSELEKS